MSDETPSAGSESTAEDPDTRPVDVEPTPDPPTAQSLPPETPASIPIQAQPPSVETLVPEPVTTPIPAPSVEYAPAPPAAGPGPVPAAPAVPGPVPAAPAPKGRATRLIAASRATPGRRALVAVGLGVVGLLLLGGVGYAIYDRFYADPLADAVAGHCLAGLPIVEGQQETEVSNARIVYCTDPAAAYLVQGRLDDVTEEQARDPLICRGFRHATQIYKAVPAGGAGYVLCLSRVEE